MNITDILFAKKLAGGGGGSNPNSVEVIEGTADTLFSSMSFDDYFDLCDALTAGNANIIAVADLSAMGFGSFTLYGINRLGNIIFSTLYMTTDVEVVNGAYVEYSTHGESVVLGRLYMITSPDVWVDGFDYAPYIPTTLTIYRHPMP